MSNRSHFVVIILCMGFWSVISQTVRHDWTLIRARAHQCIHIGQIVEKICPVPLELIIFLYVPLKINVLLHCH